MYFFDPQQKPNLFKNNVTLGLFDWKLLALSKFLASDRLRHIFQNFVYGKEMARKI
jgi:hypothetical protein